LRRPFVQQSLEDTEFWLFVEIRLATGASSFSIRLEVEDDEHEVVLDTADELIFTEMRFMQFGFAIALEEDDVHEGQYAVHVHINGSLQLTRVIYFGG